MLISEATLRVLPAKLHELGMIASRLLSSCCLCWFTVVALGLPLPAPPRVALRQTGERFPCENCPCGCATAEHCWRDCCCHTLPERLAWAHREGVTPPAFALEEARRAGVEVAHWAAARTRNVAPPKWPATRACCCSKQGGDCDAVTPQPRPTRPSDTPRPGVSVLRALSCHGLHATWLMLGAVTLAEPFVSPFDLAVGGLYAPAPLPVDWPVAAIPTPPPEAAV